MNTITILKDVKVQIAITELNSEDITTFCVQNKNTQHTTYSIYGERKWTGEAERQRETERETERDIEREREERKRERE